MRFNLDEGSRRAFRRYVESYSPKGKKTEDIHRRFSRTPNCYMAVADSKVIAVVRGIENRLVNLFVDGDFLRQGIATRPVRRLEEAWRKAGFTKAALRGSLYAAPFYESVGYEKTTGVRSFHGPKVQPMKKILKKGDSNQAFEAMS